MLGRALAEPRAALDAREAKEGALPAPRGYFYLALLVLLQHSRSQAGRGLFPHQECRELGEGVRGANNELQRGPAPAIQAFPASPRVKTPFIPPREQISDKYPDPAAPCSPHCCRRHPGGGAGTSDGDKSPPVTFARLLSPWAGGFSLPLAPIPGLAAGAAGSWGLLGCREEKPCGKQTPVAFGAGISSCCARVWVFFLSFVKAEEAAASFWEKPRDLLGASALQPGQAQRLGRCQDWFYP